MTRPLTARQTQVLDFIVEFKGKHGYPPTMREIGDSMNIKSTNGVADHLAALERKGRIVRETMVSRGIAVVPQTTAVYEGRAREIYWNDADRAQQLIAEALAARDAS